MSQVMNNVTRRTSDKGMSSDLHIISRTWGRWGRGDPLALHWEIYTWNVGPDTVAIKEFSVQGFMLHNILLHTLKQTTDGTHCKQ